MRMKHWIFLALLLLLAGCSTGVPESVHAQVEQAEAALHLITPSPQPGAQDPSSTIPSDEAPATIEMAVFEPTPDSDMPSDTRSDPFTGLRIDDLSSRSYGGPGIGIGEVVTTGPGFTQHKMVYHSDGLRITGLANIPDGEGPFPVIIVNHGYLRPVDYQTGFGSWRLADWFARHGYITLMPDYRNYGGSERGPNPFHIGYAIDVMNLAAQTGSLSNASPGQIGMIGHSMGGEIAQWPMVISNEIDGIVLYASMSGDAALNWSHARRHWPAQREAMNATALVYGTPDENSEGYAQISPLNYYHRAQMPVLIHHGRYDDTLPFAWAETMSQQMETAGVNVTFYAYAGGHGFSGSIFETMIQRSVEFFDAHVRGNVNTPGSQSDN